MKKAVVLLSGGLDSATTLAIAQADGFDCHCLTVHYGQRHSIELEASRILAQQMGVTDHRELELNLRLFGGSALTSELLVPKDDESTDEIPVTYVPARNTILLSLALAYAESIAASDIFTGFNAVDYSGYPDCRPTFVSAFQTLARLATKSGVGGDEITIHAPLIELRKADIIRRAMELGVDVAATRSCYDPDELGRACGHCDSCLIRIRAFAELGMTDPALDHQK